MSGRRCGDCTLCCKLLPVSEIGKPANRPCTYQRANKGCLVYRGPMFPRSCQLWSCGWLLNLDAELLPRPDHAHYVIDPVPDYVTVNAEDGATRRVPVVQIWVDPKHRNAHRNPRLRAWIARRGQTHGQAALIRFGSSDAMALFPPSLTGGDWVESNGQRDAPHSMADIAATYKELSS